MVNKKRQILQINKFLIFILIFTLCGGGENSSSNNIENIKTDTQENQESTTTESTTTESTTTESTTTESTTTESTTSTTKLKINEPTWGEWYGDLEIYAAADVTQQQKNVTLEWVKKGIEHWGSYGPLEIWIVGTGKDEAIALDEKWCEVRTDKDPTWNRQWDCANGDPYESGDGWSPFYRYTTDGGAAVSTYIREDVGYYFNALIMSSKYPGPDEDDYKVIVMHEYFHVYQHGNLSIPELPDTDGDWRTSNRNIYFNGNELQVPFLMEGGAEYMAQYWYSKEAGVESGYLKRIMKDKAQAIDPYLNTGKSLRELGYNESFNSYDILTWFVAYLVHNTSEETFRVDFWTQIEDLGFEKAFQSNFGKSADEMISDFDKWITQPIDVLIEIIP